jgi:hypothetical protein
MRLSDRVRELRRLLHAAVTLLRLPRARLHFHSRIAPERIGATYRLFNGRHARFPLIRNKTLGIALIDLSKFKCPAEYLATVKKKDWAAYHGKVARKRGYSVRQIDRNDFIAEIFSIHNSSDARQGRPMDQNYRNLQTRFDENPPMRSFGVFNAGDRMVGYCSFGVYGNFAATDRLIGFKNNDGTMYLLLVDIITALIDAGSVRYFMYDTFLGAQPGLKSFKQRIGFQPYRVRYSID